MCLGVSNPGGRWEVVSDRGCHYERGRTEYSRDGDLSGRYYLSEVETDVVVFVVVLLLLLAVPRPSSSVISVAPLGFTTHPQK